MASNTRALQLNKNSNEFNEKGQVIVQTLNRMASFVDEAMLGCTVDWSVLSTMAVKVAIKHGGVQYNLEAVAHYERNKVLVDIQNSGIPLSPNGRFWNLRLVRLVYDDLDAIIEAAEKFCESAGRLSDFQRKMARFEM